MARIARVVAPGYPHHITQRGNHRQETFFCKDDYDEFLRNGLTEEEVRALRKHEHRGRPSGSARFIRASQNKLARPLLPQKGGRPKKILN